MLFHLNERQSLSVIDLRPILEVLGMLIALLAALMILPFIADILTDDTNWQPFTAAGFLIAFIGGSLILSNRGYMESITNKQVVILTTLSWIILPAFAALPFKFTYSDMSYTDAFFEAMSGLTSCGATILDSIDDASTGILLWRAMLNWIGGIGIIVVAITILPMLKVGGMQLFKTEASDKSDRILPRARQLTNVTVGIYIFMTIVSALCLWTAGMSGFDALCHAMAAIATGGFSNYSDSIGHFDNLAIEIIIIITMILGCLPFVLYIQVRQGHYTALWKDSQVHAFFAILIIAILLVTFWLTSNQNMDFYSGLRLASFNVTSIMTTSGFYTGDYSSWGSFPVFMLIILSLIGGCTGSAAGGIKIFRFQILYETVKGHINHIIHPHGIFRPQFNHKSVTEGVVYSVLVFFFIYIAFFFFFVLLLAFTGVDLMTSISAIASAMAGSGFGIGNIIHPGGNFITLPNMAKWVLSTAMMMGRLEFLTILVLFNPAFWRD